MADSQQLQARYRSFAERECRGYSELYCSLATFVADDDDLSRFIAEMPETQPNLFLAAVQHLTGPEAMPRSAAALQSVVAEHRDEIRRLMHAQRTQTNEVGRCAAILLGLPRGPLALLEVGASAGLCLWLDQFHYDYGRRQLGDPAATVRLQCRVAGDHLLPAAMPEIAWRSGLDLSPVDLQHEEHVRWLLSCVWADQAERRERLEAAIRLAKTRRSLVRAGNLVYDLPSWLEEAPRDLQLVVFHSAVLAYVSAAERQAFARTLAEASRHRKIIWVSNEGSAVVPEITALAAAMPATRPAPFLLGRTTFIRGERADELLAFAHPHGAALD